MVVAIKFPRGDRNRPLLPHRQLVPIREMLQAQAELYRAHAVTYDDARWSEAADALDAAAEALRPVAR